MLRLRCALRQHECERGTDLSILTVTGTEADAAHRFRAELRLFPDTFGEQEHCRLIPSRPDSLLRMFGMSRK